MNRRHALAKALKWGSAVTLLVSIAGLAISATLNAFVLDDFDAYGEVAIPGTTTVHLPAGEVTVNYHATKLRNRGGLPVPEVKLTIEPPDGVPEPDITENAGGTTLVNLDAHRQLWVVRTRAAGDYLIRASGSTSDSGVVNPRLALGYDHSAPWAPWLFGALLIGSLVTLVAGGIWLTRVRRIMRGADLARLASLRDSGAITEGEFRKQENRILGG